MNDVTVPLSDMQRMAEAIAKSKLFGMKTTDEALALMIVAQAEGRHPGSVATEYHIIQGRPSLKADTMLARFQAASGKVTWTEYTDARVAAIFSHPNGGSVEIDWTFERAKAAGLTGKDNWRNYPRQMLRARVISEGVRTVYPGVSIGIYTPEEVLDFEPDSPLRALQAVDVKQLAREEMAATGEAGSVSSPESENPAPPEAPAQNGNAAARRGVCTAPQAKLLHTRMSLKGISEEQYCEKFGVARVSETEFRKVNDALAWIDAHG